MLSLESTVHYFTLDIGSPHLACISLADKERKTRCMVSDVIVVVYNAMKKKSM
jgi:hypothetical protein